MKRILVAIDASEQAGYALDTAISLARDSGAQLQLVHVFVAPPTFNPEYRLVDTEARKATMYAEQARLDQAQTKVPSTIPNKTLMTEGEPAAEIIRAARDFRADLIVMGTHGRGRIATAFLGSVAYAVTQRSICPVLTVSHAPSDLATDAPSQTAWTTTPSQHAPLITPPPNA